MEDKNDPKEQARLLSELAAAQLVEQVKRIGTNQIVIPIADQPAGWVVWVTKVEADEQSGGGDHDGHHKL